MGPTDNADGLRELLNGWGPFKAQRLEVLEVGGDWSHAVIRMGLEADNGNYFGTAFGGTLFSMVDPFFVILAVRQLGEDYVVWDKAAEITFVKPGTSAVTARVEMPAGVIEEIRLAAADGDKVLRWFDVDMIDEEGDVVARARRQLYVRKKKGL